MTNAGQLDITIDQGAGFLLPFQLIGDDGNPVSLSLATIAGEIRKTPQDTTVLATFVCTVMDGPNGVGQAEIAAADTAAIPVDNSEEGDRVLTQYMYDIEVTFSDGFVQRILQGSAFVSPEVSR